MRRKPSFFSDRDSVVETTSRYFFSSSVLNLTSDTYSSNSHGSSVILNPLDYTDSVFSTWKKEHMNLRKQRAYNKVCVGWGIQKTGVFYLPGKHLSKLLYLFVRHRGVTSFGDVPERRAGKRFCTRVTPHGRGQRHQWQCSTVETKDWTREDTSQGQWEPGGNQGFTWT